MDFRLAGSNLNGAYSTIMRVPLRDVSYEISHETLWTIQLTVISMKPVHVHKSGDSDMQKSMIVTYSMVGTIRDLTLNKVASVYD